MPRCYETGDVRHVDGQVGANLVSNFAEPFPVGNSRVGREPGNDHPRLMLLRQLVHLGPLAVLVEVLDVGHQFVPLLG